MRSRSGWTWARQSSPLRVSSACRSPCHSANWRRCSAIRSPRTPLWPAISLEPSAPPRTPPAGRTSTPTPARPRNAAGRAACAGARLRADAAAGPPPRRASARRTPARAASPARTPAPDAPAAAAADSGAAARASQVGYCSRTSGYRASGSLQLPQPGVERLRQRRVARRRLVEDDQELRRQHVHQRHGLADQRALRPEARLNARPPAPPASARPRRRQVNRDGATSARLIPRDVSRTVPRPCPGTTRSKGIAPSPNSSSV